MIQIINIKTYPNKDFIYCARGSIFGNPFEIGRDGNREEVIKKYKKWFNFLLKDKRFVNELIKLKDQNIGCFCDYPRENCHLSIIKEYLDNL